MHLGGLATVFLLVTSTVTFAVRADTLALVMFEQQGCPWCLAFHRDIGAIYPKTAEGRRAPLRVIDIHQPMPDDLVWMDRERITPMFVLVAHGAEVGRIRGYPGEDFFWGLLSELINRHDKQQK